MSTLETAILLAAKGHMNIKDKAGMPYILHPLKIMLKMDSEEEMITAVLHDLIEDTKYTIKDLNDKGFSAAVLEAVDYLSHKAGTSYEDYIESLKGNPIARKVKIADLEDNMDLKRIRNPTDKDMKRLKKYRRFCGELKVKEAEEQIKDFDRKVVEKNIKVSIDTENPGEAVWVRSDNFSLVRKNGVWKKSIPTAYELMDDYGPLMDSAKAKKIIQNAMLALKSDASLFLFHRTPPPEDGEVDKEEGVTLKAEKNEAQIGRYAQMMMDHLEENEPEKYEALVEEDYLEQFCQSKGEQAQYEKESLMVTGFLRDHEAEEIVMKDFLTIQ
jgi:hypothetical protein